MARYYAPYCFLNEDVLGEALCYQAREELKYAREQLRRYRQHANREVVRGTDEVRYMGGHTGINYGLWALVGVCDRFQGVAPLNRLVRVLTRHAERLDRQFTALYERDRDQVKAAHNAERNAEWRDFCKRHQIEYKPIHGVAS
jgi:hypothetical protein